MIDFKRFQPTLFEFLEQLADHNNRPWFQENKLRYEQEVLSPALAFIRAFQSRLKRISPYFLASDRRVGGSLMRVYRDTRFAKQGPPYKTNVGIQFRHEQGRDIHAPGFYVHIAPGECFLAVGLWRPEAEPLAAIRQAIVERPDRCGIGKGQVDAADRQSDIIKYEAEFVGRFPRRGRAGRAGRSACEIPGLRRSLLRRQPSFHAFPVRRTKGAVLSASLRKGG